MSRQNEDSARRDDMRVHAHESLGEIVAADYRAAAVFERFGLDFCCGGSKTLHDACQQRTLDLEALLRELSDLPEDERATDATANAWPLDALIEHIVARHHAYVKTALPTLAAHATRIAAVHGARNPALKEVARLVDEIAGAMSQHMMKEEQILFPYIRSLVDAERGGVPIAASPFGTVHNPIRMMETEHQEAGDQIRRIRKLTGDYSLPLFACTTYRICFKELQEFERDLHWHVHLENNVLFPRAILLEESLFYPRESLGQA
jgi:regulator of cell morphogenesis and NO signaling